MVHASTRTEQSGMSTQRTDIYETRSRLPQTLKI